MTAENPFLNFKARSLLLVGFLISLATGFAFGLLSSFSGLNPQDPIFVPIIYTLTFVFLSLWARHRLHRLQINFKHIIGHLPDNYPWLPTVAIVIAILLFSLGSGHLFFYGLSFYAPRLVESLLKQKTFLSDSETFAPLLYNLLTVVVVTVVAPLTEELIFRGILLHRWSAKWGITSALLISALLFAVLHANIIGLFVFGLMMALLYIKTRTLIVPILCHSLNNFVAIGLELVSISSGTPESVDILEQLHSDWWVGVVYIVLSAPWLISFIFKNWPKRGSYLPYFVNTAQSQDNDKDT
jgi:hypothetical protein